MRTCAVTHDPPLTLTTSKSGMRCLRTKGKEYVHLEPISYLMKADNSWTASGLPSLRRYHSSRPVLPATHSSKGSP